MNQTVLQKMMFWRRWIKRGSNMGAVVADTSSRNARSTKTSTNQRRSTPMIGSLNAMRDARVDASISRKRFLSSDGVIKGVVVGIEFTGANEITVYSTEEPK